ncbi:MAG: hypothetical protein JNL97_10345, partial [Verrucomicrobiales bacterium]|nr:hypothetical protein [Verrucomicrobiales bacterium]
MDKATRSAISRLLYDHGMVFVLLLLCGFFSVVTQTEQTPTGEAAAKQVLAAMRAAGGRTSTVMVVASDQPEDAAFLSAVEKGWGGPENATLIAVRGEPRQARATLERLVSEGKRLDALLVTRVTGSWLVLKDLGTDFPA